MVGFAVASARWLGAEGKGELTLIITAGAVVGSLLSLGIPQALTAWVARDDLGVKDALALGLPFVLALSFFLALIVRPMGPGLAPAITLLWLSAGMTAYEYVVVALAVGSGDLWPPLVLRLLGGGLLVLAFSAAWLLAIAPTMANAVALYFGITALGVSLALVSLLRRTGPALDPWSRRLREVRPLLAFGFSALPALLLGVTNYKADVLLLGSLSGAAEVGVYSVAVSATLLAGLIPAALAQALTRGFGVADDPGVLLRRGMQASIMAGLATALVIALASWFLVVPVLGREFAQASLLIAVMAPFAGFFSGAQVSSSYFYNTLRRPVLQSAVIGTTATVDVILVLALAPTYGALGAALASAVGYAAGSAANLILCSRTSGVRIRDLVVSSPDDLRWMWTTGLRLLDVREGRVSDAHSL